MDFNLSDFLGGLREKNLQKIRCRLTFIIENYIKFARITLKGKSMTQMTITLDLEDYVKPSEIKRLLKNIKGVIKVSNRNHSPTSRKQNAEDKEWLSMVDRLQNSVSPSDIDWGDERTRYIMGER